MKQFLGTIMLAVASTGVAAAQPDWGLKGNQYDFSQPRPVAAPAAPAREKAPNRTCVLEAALLQKVASMRDMGVKQNDAERVIAQDATRGNSYSEPFISNLSKRTDWIYRHGWVRQDAVQMGYLKECDPGYFNWY